MGMEKIKIADGEIGLGKTVFIVWYWSHLEDNYTIEETAFLEANWESRTVMVGNSRHFTMEDMEINAFRDRRAAEMCARLRRR
jgi:hypothetical protein